MTEAQPKPTAETGHSLRLRLPLMLAIVWLVAMFLLYYIRHNPLEPLRGFSWTQFAAGVAAALDGPDRVQAALHAVGLNLIDILAVGLLITVGGALGRFILPAQLPLSDTDRPFVHGLVGLGAISIVVLAAGLFGLFPGRWLAWGISIVLALGLRRQVVDWLKDFAAACHGLLRPSPDHYTRWLMWAILVLLALPLFEALLLPVQWDALTYHLAGPRLYLDAGRIVSFPENHFLGFPQLVEMLYLWLMILARPNSAGLMHGCFAFAASVLTLSLARRAGRPTAGAIAVLGLLACDSLWGELMWPYNDLALMACLVAAVGVAFDWVAAQGDHSNGLLIVVGALVGMAMGVKYTAAGSAIGVAALIAWMSRKDRLVTLARRCGMVSIVALIVFSPWLIKNALLDGNPLSPFVWGTRAFDRFDQYYYLRPGTGLDPASVILAPIQATVFGQAGSAPYGGSTGVLAFTLVPLAALGWKQRGQAERDLIIGLGIFVIPAYVVWIIGVATSWYLVQTRLLYPIFPALLVIGGLGVEGVYAQRLVPDPGKIARLIVAAAAVVAVWVGLFLTVLSGDWLTSVGFVGEQQYLTTHLGDFYLAMQQINGLPDGSRVQMLWEPRTFYCQPRCIPDSMIDQWWHDRQTVGDPHRIVQRWRDAGITHVLVFEKGLTFLTTEDKYEPLTGSDVAALDEIRRSDLVSIWRSEGYTLYQIRAVSP